jgi:hypothetical protein
VDDQKANGGIVYKKLLIISSDKLEREVTEPSFLRKYIRSMLERRRIGGERRGGEGEKYEEEEK